MGRPEAAAEATLERAGGIVWRQAADRVLVRRIGDRSGQPSLELRGSAALVWVALDGPRRRAAVRQELATEVPGLVVDVDAAIDHLVETGLIVATPT